MIEWWTRKGKRVPREWKRFVIALKRAKKHQPFVVIFPMPIKVNSIIKALLTNTRQSCQWIYAYVNRWFECFINIATNGTYFNWMFVFTCLWNETDGRAFTWLSTKPRGRWLLGAKTQLKNFVSSHRDRRKTNAIASRSLQFHKGFPYFKETFWLPQQFISCSRLHLLPLKLLRGLHLPGVHR